MRNGRNRLNTDGMPKLQKTTSTLWHAEASDNSILQAVGSSRIQLSFDFSDNPKSNSTSTIPTQNTPAMQFASFAALLEADRNAQFDNAVISSLAREIFGNSAGHAVTPTMLRKPVSTFT